MKFRYILSSVLLSASAIGFAQTAVTFETEDYKSIGVYDTWEESPFRTGVLSGNCAVTENPDKALNEIIGIAPNESDKVLAIQRSRFGSNTFGARVDLNETFELTPTPKYIHVMLHRPYSGRVMVVGLGKRRERSGQSPETEQFWALSTSNIEGGKWQDVVLPVKGAGGIDIYSLVVVPDCESPHNYANDAICYIDNIEVNDNPLPKFNYAYYPINFGKEQNYARSDRRLGSISLTAPSDGEQSYTIPSSPNRMYHLVTKKKFRAKAGESITPAFGYTGNAMHRYVYLDKNNDGKFTVPLNDDNSVADGSEAVSYSYYNGKSSTGASVANNSYTPPAFTLPSDLENGHYRMRYKIDWNCIDPAGNIDPNNTIVNNGGAIVDVILNIHGDFCSVNDANRNGEVLSANGEKLVKLQVPFGEPFTIKMNPEQGFEYAGIIVKHGYNLSGDSVVRDNMQWERVRISRELFNENDEFTIPGELMDGDVEIEGLFIEEGTYVPEAPRYAVTKITNGEFSPTTTWYTLQIGNQGYVLSNNGTASHISLSSTTLNTEDAAQLWCFTGNDYVGYRIYNMQSGTSKVLAAPIEMKGTTGGESYPTMQPADALPLGYTDLWLFSDSRDVGSGGPAYSYMYEKDYEANKVNNRDYRLAFWNAGADAGSTLWILPAEGNLPSSIHPQISDNKEHPVFDLFGRRTLSPTEGIYIKNGKKLLNK